MSACEFQTSGAPELYFYGEGAPAERAAFQEHLSTCADCRRALQELSIIRAALASRPDVAAPSGGNWSTFMARLGDAVARLREGEPPVLIDFHPRAHHGYVRYLAMAALLALVTMSVLFVARARQGIAPGQRNATAAPHATDATNTGTAARGTGPTPRSADVRADDDAAFAAVSGQHFDRAKLVVLGLATRDATAASARDWTYERQLASSLLDDTRLYRLVAEQRGMNALARVMGDLELVLLQASMSERSDTAALEQLQRLIAKRDLVTKMEVVTTGL